MLKEDIKKQVDIKKQEVYAQYKATMNGVGLRGGKTTTKSNYAASLRSRLKHTYCVLNLIQELVEYPQLGEVIQDDSIIALDKLLD